MLQLGYQHQGDRHRKMGGLPCGVKIMGCRKMEGLVIIGIANPIVDIGPSVNHIDIVNIGPRSRKEEGLPSIVIGNCVGVNTMGRRKRGKLLSIKIINWVGTTVIVGWSGGKYTTIWPQAWWEQNRSHVWWSIH